MPREARAKPLIEAAAIKLFARDGVEATTTSAVAAEAGVSEAAIYRHFESKEALLHAVFAEHYHAFGRLLAEAARPRAGLRGKLAAMIEEVCRAFDADPDRTRFLLLAQHRSLPRLETDADSPVEVVRALVAEAVAAGQIPEQDPDLAAAMAFGLVLQPATFRAYGRINRPLSDDAPRIAAACWKVLHDA